MKNIYHCGACKKKFETSKELMKHLDSCRNAIIGKGIIDDVFSKLIPKKKGKQK